VCFDVENFGVNALCVENCGAGTGTNCKTVCEYFGVKYVSSKQCRNAGTAEDRSNKMVVGNTVCKANPPEPKRVVCCKCDKFSDTPVSASAIAACRAKNQRCSAAARCCAGMKCNSATKRCK
jgi:hypothetical protein